MAIILEIDDGGGTFEPVACLLEYSETEDTELIGTTVRQNGGWKTSKGLVQGKAITGTGIVPKDAAQLSWKRLQGLKRNRTRFVARIDTETYWAFITELTLDAQGDNDLGFSFKILVTDTPDAPSATPPSGYTIEWETLVANLEIPSATARIDGGTSGDLCELEVTSSGGGTPVTASFTIGSDPQGVGVGISTLPEGELTISCTLTNGDGSGPQVSSTSTIDYVTTPDNGGIFPGNASIAIPARETSIIGSAGWTNEGTIITDFLAETILDSVGGGVWALRVTQVTGVTSGRIYTFTGLTPGTLYRVYFNVRSDDGAGGAGDAEFYALQDGGNLSNSYSNTAWMAYNVDLTVRAVGDLVLFFRGSLSRTPGNRSFWANLRVVEITAPPSGYAVAFGQDPVSTPASLPISITGGNGEGTQYNYAIVSSGGGSPIASTGNPLGSTPENFNVDVTSLPAGTLTINMTITGPGGNQVITDTTTKP